MVNIDVCVLTAGRVDLLRKCLDAIQMQDVDAKLTVYLLDNGMSRQVRMENQDVFRHPVIDVERRRGDNIGYPGGANQVIGLGHNELVLFISDDIVLQPGAIQSLLDTMQNDKQIGLCGLKLIFPKDSSDPGRPAGRVQHVRHAVNLRGEVVHQFVGWSADNPRCNVSGECFSVTGAVFMTRRTAFNKAGKFNVIYGSGTYEDVELALNIRSAGYKIWVDTNAVAEHYVGATAQLRKEPFKLDQNKSIFLQRNAKRLVWTEWELA